MRTNLLKKYKRRAERSVSLFGEDAWTKVRSEDYHPSLENLMRDSSPPQRRRRRPRSGGGGQSQGRPPEAGSGENRSAGAPRRPRRRRGGSSRPLSGPQVIQKYLNLLDQHMINRRKYFEYFDREEGRHRRRLEKNFFTSIEQLRRFEERLEPWQKELLKAHVDRYRLDLTYSGNHELSPVAEPAPLEGDFPDPHFKEEQVEAFTAYAEDREESVGTYDDYLQYKAAK